MKGNPACMELFKVIKADLERVDLIDTMKKRSDDIKSRGNCSFQIDRKKNLTKEIEEAVSIAIDGLNNCLE